MNNPIAIVAILLSVIATTGCAATQKVDPGLEQYQGCIENIVRDNPHSPLVDKAKKRFEAACATGDAAGCSMLATIAYRRARTDDQLKGALALFNKACRGGNVGACANAANIKDQLKPGDKDALLGVLAFACVSDNRSICRDLAEKVAVHGLPRQPLQVEKALRAACSKMRVGSACMQLGKIADAQIKVAADIKPAQRHYLRACALGEKSGCSRARELRHIARKSSQPKPARALALATVAKQSGAALH